MYNKSEMISYELQVISLILQLVKSNSQLTNSNLQLVILFPTCKINLQLVKRQLVNLIS